MVDVINRNFTKPRYLIFWYSYGDSIEQVVRTIVNLKFDGSFEGQWQLADLLSEYFSTLWHRHQEHEMSGLEKLQRKREIKHFIEKALQTHNQQLLNEERNHYIIYTTLGDHLQLRHLNPPPALIKLNSFTRNHTLLQRTPNPDSIDRTLQSHWWGSIIQTTRRELISFCDEGFAETAIVVRRNLSPDTRWFVEVD